MDDLTIRRAETWGCYGLPLLLALALAAAGFTGELGGRVFATAGVMLLVAASAGAMRPPIDPRTWLMRWPLLALLFLLVFGELAPTAGSLAAGFYVVTFVYIGIVAAPRVGLALLPLPVVGIWSALDLPPAQVVVRITAATLAITMASQMPSRLMVLLAQRRRELESEHQAVQAAQRMASSNASKFSRVFELSPVGMALADERGRFAEVNPALCDMLGRTPTELLGSGAEPFLVPEDRVVNGQVEALMDETDDGVVELEQRFLRPDGVVVTTLVTLAPLSGPRGERWTMAHLVDITDRTRAEHEAGRAQLLTAVVARIAQATQRSEDPRPVAIEGLASLTGADTVFVIEERTPGILVVTCARGADVEGVELPLDRLSVTSHVWETGVVKMVSDLAGEPMVAPALVKLIDARSALWQPVRDASGDTVAVLMAGWHESVDLDLKVDTTEALATEMGAALAAEGMRVALQTSAVTDGLTGLLNRRGWDQAAAPLLAQTIEREQPMVVAMVDLDHFKTYNDTYGHAAGDDLLRSVTSALTSTLRVSDLVSRWGGDELAAALPGCSLEAARATFERFRAALPEGQTCSVGLAACAKGEDVAQAMVRADANLYAAKASRPVAGA